jgi:carbamoyltransferase
MNKTGYIAAIVRGHNAGVCLLKDGEMVFSIEEERLSRRKYDGGPFASMIKILDYTDKVDYLVVAHTTSLEQTAGKIDYSGDDMYTALARKLGLIDKSITLSPHPQVIDLSFQHHKLHAACAFYRSGFEDAVAVIVDGAGTFLPLQINNEQVIGFETESIFECSYPSTIQTIYKHIGTRGPHAAGIVTQIENEKEFTSIVTDTAGIVKVYEAVTQYCGFSSIEAGKTMGLFPYGAPNSNIPKLFNSMSKISHSNRNVIIPTYPNGASINLEMYDELAESESDDITKLQNRRDLAYACQIETQEQVLELIKTAVKTTGKKNVIVSGGYGLNCVANYFYLDKLKDDGINLYIEPISSDAGTAIGAAFWFYHQISGDKTVRNSEDCLYLGPKYQYTTEDIITLSKKYSAEVIAADNDKIVDLLTNKNIVAVFQGRSENGPRALGNRSILFDPTFKDGKDFVNGVKRREYFRPFAGSILEEDVHEWFDLRGMPSSPTMMYAVNCKEGVAEKVPSIIHVDDTCRIQTVNRDQNPHYYDIIKAFKDRTGVPIVFNTSFNLGGEPLVETLEDALWTLQQSDIEYLYLPEHAVLIKVLNNSK